MFPDLKIDGSSNIPSLKAANAKMLRKSVKLPNLSSFGLLFEISL
jgi:hypothetical protein